MTLLRPVLLLVLAATLLVSESSVAADGHWALAGFRGGFPSNVPRTHLYQFETFGDYVLPWEMRSRSGWGAAAELGFAAGVLTGEGDYGFVGTAGPALVVGNPGFPLALNLGIGAAILSRDQFGGKDYNGYFQFVSHGGVEYVFGNGFALTYRFQHMSNAGFNGNHNPGVNVHLFGIGWSFNNR